MLINSLVKAIIWNKRLQKIPLKLLRIIPISSAILGPPKGYYSSAKKWFSLFSKSEDASYVELNLGHTLFSKEPKTLDDTIHWRFQGAKTSLEPLPPGFVVTIPNGRLWNNNAVISPDDKLIADLSRCHAKVYREMPEHHPINSQWKLPSAKYIEGTVVALSVAGASKTYAHWMLDLLPRLELLYETGISNHEVDQFVVNGIKLPFQKETLSRLGIPHSKILDGSKYPQIYANRLVIPSLPRGYLDSVPQTPRWVCDFLKKTFLPTTAVNSVNEVERIYISRARANRRRVLNEKELTKFLNQLAFRTIYLEEMSVTEQAQTFAAAKCIVAPHGAGLTNLAFCCPNTKVVELFAPHYIHYAYWILSNQIGLDYYYLIGEGERPTKNQYRHWYAENIYVNIQSLSKLMKLAKVY